MMSFRNNLSRLALPVSSDVLHRSSEGWHEGRHDLLPWLNFFLAILKRAYRELDRLPA
ncbi:MAG: hypothetical protein ACJ76Y_07815 [Thermoanaerobaculia bacterium]